MARRALLSSTAQAKYNIALLVERLQAEITRRLRLNVAFTPHALVASPPDACERAQPRHGRSRDRDLAGHIHHTRRGDREIAVGPPVGCGEDFLEDLSRLSVNRPILPSLAGDFTGITRVEYEGALQRQAVATVPP
jgi:hypothetical protein